MRWCGYPESGGVLTLWNGKKADQNESILMSLPGVITNIPNRKVNGVVVMLASCHRNSRFVGPEYDRDKDRPVCININGNEVLFVARLAGVSIVN